MANINKVAIIGKGMIGSSFATLFTGNGIETIVLAKDEAVGRQRYKENYDYLIENKLVTHEQYEKCEKLLSFTEDYKDLKDIQVVIECVAEDLKIKQEVYKKLEENCPNLVAVGSASSAISPNDLVNAGILKDKVLVAHPYNPPHMVPLVEVVPAESTSKEAVDAICELLVKAHRRPAMMNRPAPGFISNRIQHAMIREGLHMIQEGICSAEDIDNAIMYSFGPRYTSIGLFEHVDNAGLDLAINVENYLFADLGNETTAGQPVVDAVARGDLGRKTGKGLHDWTKKDIPDFLDRAAKPYLTFFNWDLPE